MLGTLSPQQTEEVLATGLIGRIGCHADGETYVVPISYAYDGTALYCHTHEGKKTAIMRQNPNVCFEVEDMKDMGNWKSVIVQGTFYELKEQGKRAAAMKVLLNRYLPFVSSVTTHLGDAWPFQPDDTKEIKGIVFCINIREKSGRFEEGGVAMNMLG